jgi:hypothetical protein
MIRRTKVITVVSDDEHEMCSRILHGRVERELLVKTLALVSKLYSGPNSIYLTPHRGAARKRRVHSTRVVSVIYASMCEHVFGSSPGSRPLVAASEGGSTTSRLPIASSTAL